VKSIQSEIANGLCVTFFINNGGLHCYLPCWCGPWEGWQCCWLSML
jgi:hypothetical protein